MGKLASASAGSWFHSWIVLFAKEYLPICSSETLVSTYQTARCRNTQDHNTTLYLL